MRTVVQAAHDAVLESVFEALAVGVGVAADGRFVEANSELLSLLGRSREDVLGALVVEVLGLDRDVQVGERWLRVSTSQVEAGDGRSLLTVYGVVDVTGLHTRALYDAVTGLPNRHLVEDRLRHSLAHARRTGSQTAVLFVDLDGFKAVNDVAGHRVGDAVLRQTGERISAAARASDTVGRWAGDEFVVLCEELRSLGDAALVATRIREACSQPFVVGDDVFALGASVGMASSRATGDGSALLEMADAEMYTQKRTRAV